MANAGLIARIRCALLGNFKSAGGPDGRGATRDHLWIILRCVAVSCATVSCAPATRSYGADTARRSLVANGSFEEATAQDPSRRADWYYVQQMQVIDAADAPHGRQFLRFRNSVPGRPAQAQQHVTLDGRKVRALDASVWVAVRGAASGQALADRPSMRIRFYDTDDAQVGEEVLGPWAGTHGWSQETARVVVPESARLALVVIGLGGGTGEADFDLLELTPADVNASALPPRVRP